MTERAPIRFVVVAHACVRARPYPTAPIIRAAHVGETLPGERVAGHGYQGSVEWAKVTLPSSVVGYIWAGYGEWREA